jgi:Maltose acetyltransferase
MSTERERMLAGELYDPLDAELVATRERARSLCHALNATKESEGSQETPHSARPVRRRWRYCLDATALLL